MSEYESWDKVMAALLAQRWTVEEYADNIAQITCDYKPRPNGLSLAEISDFLEKDEKLHVNTDVKKNQLIISGNKAELANYLGVIWREFVAHAREDEAPPATIKLPLARSQAVAVKWYSISGAWQGAATYFSEKEGISARSRAQAYAKILPEEVQAVVQKVLAVPLEEAGANQMVFVPQKNIESLKHFLGGDQSILPEPKHYREKRSRSA